MPKTTAAVMEKRCRAPTARPANAVPMRGTRAIQAGGTARVALRASNRNGTRMIRCFGVTFPRKAPMTMSPTPIRNGAKTTESNSGRLHSESRASAGPASEKSSRNSRTPRPWAVRKVLKPATIAVGRAFQSLSTMMVRPTYASPMAKLPWTDAQIQNRKGRVHRVAGRSQATDDQGEQGQREQHRSGHQERDHQQCGEGDDDRRRPLAPAIVGRTRCRWPRNVIELRRSIIGGTKPRPQFDSPQL